MGQWFSTAGIKNVDFQKEFFKGDFTMLVTGKAGVGKTREICDLLEHCLPDSDIDSVHYFVNDNENNYCKLHQFIGNKIKHVHHLTGPSNKNWDFFDQWDNSTRKLFVIDTPLSNYNSEQVDNLFSKCKRYKCSVILVAQQYYSTPINIRKNCNSFLFFDSGCKADFMMLSRDHGDNLFKSEKEHFKTMISTAVKDSFLLLDMRHPVDVMRVRKGWDKIWNKDIEDWTSLCNAHD